MTSGFIIIIFRETSRKKRQFCFSIQDKNLKNIILNTNYFDVYSVFKESSFIVSNKMLN